MLAAAERLCGPKRAAAGRMTRGPMRVLAGRADQFSCSDKF
jgi:hypothetical protein